MFTRISRSYSQRIVKDLGKLVLQPKDWRCRLGLLKSDLFLLKIANAERHTPVSTNIFGTEIELVDSVSFIGMYSEIFDNNIYKFKAQTQAPFIIDGGANIGLSTLYFKQLYPNSHIIAFEPDQKIFNVLQKNIQKLKYSNVELVNKALWSSETVLEFMSEGTEAGRLSLGELESERYQVPTVRLRKYLDKQVDLLKLDIEGAELEVIKDCSDLLFNVENLFVEYHSFANQPQSLNVLVNILNEAGFRLHIHAPYVVSPQPFYNHDVSNGIDMLLNIFAWRE